MEKIKVFLSIDELQRATNSLNDKILMQFQNMSIGEEWHFHGHLIQLSKKFEYLDSRFKKSQKMSKMWSTSELQMALKSSNIDILGWFQNVVIHEI